jgi:hypothetical protein
MVRGTTSALDEAKFAMTTTLTNLDRDLKTLALFIRVYCRKKHAEEVKSVIQVRDYDIEELAGERIVLCSHCAKLLQHAFYKRSHCPMEPKPACKHCPSHCYHPTYRAQIRQVMKFSGRHLLLSGRLDYLFHLLF